jgi:hypothetical protein
MRKKILVGICVAAVGVFLADRLLTGVTPGAAEAEAAGVVESMAKAAQPSSQGESPLGQDAGKAVRTMIADRLDRQAAHASDNQPVRDAFCAGTSWIGAPKSPAATTTSDEARAREFAAQHKLTATFVGAEDGRAIVDGRGLMVGQTLDGFTLVSVDRVSAQWTREGVEVRLTLQPATAEGQ